MKRLLIALGIVVAAAPFWVALWIAFDEGEHLVLDAERPPAAPPKPPRRVEVPLAESPVERLRDAWKHRAPAAPSPARLGRLDVVVSPREVAGGVIRVTALLPTGEHLGTLTADRKGACRFESLPHDVPLVVRVEAPGFLTGHCCDVVLPAGVAREKAVVLAKAPVVTIRVLDSTKGRRVPGASVELRRGDDVVALGTTDDDGEVVLAPPVVGRLTARVAAEGLASSGDTSIDVWPAEKPIACEIPLSVGGAVEVQVLAPSGAPAPGVDVWLVGESNTAPLVRTDTRGIAVFRGIVGGMKLRAIARAADGTVASAPVTTNPGAPERVPVLLGKPGPLVGDVVDPGGSVVVGAEVEVRIRPFGEPVTVRSDDTGRFETPPLPAGLADVTVRREGFVEWRSGGVVLVEPSVGARLRARLARLPTGTVYVTVKDANGRPLEDAYVKLYPSGRSLRTGAEGTCRFDELPAGVEQAVFARIRGFRARGPSSTEPSVVLPRADVAQRAEVTLVALAGPPAEPGPCSIRGVLLTPDGRPVEGALVEAGPWCTGSGADGSFLLEGVKPTSPGEPLEFRVSKVPWPLERIRFLVDADAAGVLDFGTVRLATQPYARIEVPARQVRKDESPVSVFWLSTNHADTFLGRTAGRFEPVACVSYDGSWLHLPPPDDWRTDGRGEVFVAYPTAHGIVTGTAAWTLRPNAAEVLRPAPRSRPGRLDVGSVFAKSSDRPLLFRQVTCDTMFDPRSLHVPTGDEQPLVDPFASLTTQRCFLLDRLSGKTTVDDVAPGRWRVHAGRDASGEADVPEETRVRVVK